MQSDRSQWAQVDQSRFKIVYVLTIQGAAFARWYRFWPILKRPQEDIGTPMITNEGGRLFSLSVRLVVIRGHVCLYNGEGETVPLAEVSPASGDLSNNEDPSRLTQAIEPLIQDHKPKR